MIDRLPFPYGLVRYGVAADHQGTKFVTAQFDRMFERDGVEFIGGIEIGRDLNLPALLDSVDLIVWAGGLTADRELGIPGEDLPGVYRAGEVSRAWNAHPAQQWNHIRIAPEVAIVGAGNVAIDIARLLLKDEAELEGSDLDEVFAGTIPDGVTAVTIISRAAPAAARWDTAMIRELVGLRGIHVELDTVAEKALADASKTGHEPSSLLLEAHRRSNVACRATLRMVFSAEPRSIEGSDRVTAIAIRHGGDVVLLPCGTVVTAIGFEAESVIEHERVIRVGWARTGARGTIPEQRSAAKALATEIAERLSATSSRPGLKGILAHTEAAYTYADWLAIDAAERAAAPSGRVRRKFRDLEELGPLLSTRGTEVNA